MMMSNPEDHMFENLLSDYIAPVEDDGFSVSVMAMVKAKQRKTLRVKKRLIAVAVVMGGAIAALQVPAFIRMTSNVAAPTMPSLSEMPYWAPAVLMVFVFMLWALLDNKGSEVI